MTDALWQLTSACWAIIFLVVAVLTVVLTVRFAIGAYRGRDDVDVAMTDTRTKTVGSTDAAPPLISGTDKQVPSRTVEMREAIKRPSLNPVPSVSPIYIEENEKLICDLIKAREALHATIRYDEANALWCVSDPRLPESADPIVSIVAQSLLTAMASFVRGEPALDPADPVEGVVAQSLLIATAARLRGAPAASTSP